ncbi:EAL domain, c-di-GMP-specific phosphodiesterase class I (or its enzymatically inactive variant) [Lachnospiraceae bacterium XBB1006]|nr:EAL domain, c-di-GMP-specific phosphodiesterase class I (or its enzymatically inactive variant) [Lachnospiraceae bacterium XBB1006]
MVYTIYFDVSAVILILVLATYFFITQNIKNKETVMFAHLLTATLLAAIFDILSAYLGAQYGQIPAVVNYFCDEVYLLSANGITFAYFIYIYIITTKKESSISAWQFLGIGVPYLCVVLLVLTSPFNHAIFFYDKGQYCHGEYAIVLYLISFGYILLALFRTLLFRKLLVRGRVMFIVGYTVIMLAVVIYQGLNPTMMVVQYGAAISCLVIYFSLENPSGYKDQELDLYNVKGFCEIYRYNVYAGRRFQILAVQIEGIDGISSVIGLDVQNELMKDAVEELERISGSKRCCRMSEEMFCIIAKKTPEEWELVRSQIGERFRKPFWYRDMQINLRAHMCMLEKPEEIPKAEDAIDMMRFALQKVMRDYGESIGEADTVELSEGRREAYVVQAMKRALENHGFCVYYQPIFSAKEGRYVRAEALVRLFDEELGMIPPDEFIPLAEQKGLITEIGAYVFSDVCAMLKRERIWEKGIERVDVNLSGIQCMQENLAERMIDIMDAYQVPYKAVNFEITETAAILSKTTLKRNMEVLLQKGVNFAMDDYGNGYSNTMTIIDNPFSDIKIDKSMLWSAMGNTLAMQALKHTIYMLQDMGFEIIVEGVENAEMSAMLQKLGCTLHQGFYYAKPLAEAEFIELVKTL